ncbi:hypothetical protein C5167_042645 [Papaver somniferum]|uniref:Uncharacterized protein n=1 Tax=Papaver somniferum TaxID=3469 RepID=A0A4Y7L643_PAPSO|nr:hypothetical protein C5167_042645 [Papaver somniferum]
MSRKLLNWGTGNSILLHLLLSSNASSRRHQSNLYILRSPLTSAPYRLPPPTLTPRSYTTNSINTTVNTTTPNSSTRHTQTPRFTTATTPSTPPLPAKLSPRHSHTAGRKSTGNEHRSMVFFLPVLAFPTF